MKLKKSTIVLIVLAVIFLGLSVVSTKYSVTRTITAIDEIGDMTTVSTDSKRRRNIIRLWIRTRIWKRRSQT